MALTTDLSLSVVATLTKTLDLANNPEYPLDYSQKVQLATGTAAGQADVMFTDTRTITASSSEDLDLVGSLTDALGTTFSPARVKALIVKAAAANTNNVVVGGASATQWAALLGTTGTVVVRPGAFFAAVAGVADATGYVCAAGSTDLLKVANSSSGTSVTYDIIVIGCSA
jgi:hypothetical protein